MTTHSITADRVVAVAPSTLRRLRACLLEEHRRRLELAADQERRAAGLAGGAHPGDDVERNLALALAAQARETTDEIQLALDRIDAGAYGRCEGCGDPLPLARLEAIPYARGCVDCLTRGALPT